MPEHVHAILGFPEPDQPSRFMKQWKQRSSVQIKRLLGLGLIRYGDAFGLGEPVWQARYYDFSLFTAREVEEKLTHMHQNPVRAGLVKRAADWPWSSARYHEDGRSVGVPVGWLD